VPSWRRLALIAMLALGAIGCGAPGPTELPLGPVPDAEMSLTANNQSDRTLELFVNGSKIGDVAATTQSTIAARDLPPFPWAAELRLPTGRTLLSLTITSGSVVRTASGSQGVGTRVDLSCGRIELWAVIPLGGPPPGPGRPGDCGP
jgi:predicted small lipoprotein YifL